MRHPADDRLKALLNGVLTYSILFLALLPLLGWTWHRVLPEHTHVFIGATRLAGDEGLPPSPAPDEEQSICYTCSGTQLSSGRVHLPSGVGLQVLGIAATGSVILAFVIPPIFPERVMIPRFSYRSPILLPPDPPPNGLDSPRQPSLV